MDFPTFITILQHFPYTLNIEAL